MPFSTIHRSAHAPCIHSQQVTSAILKEAPPPRENSPPFSNSPPGILALHACCQTLHFATLYIFLLLGFPMRTPQKWFSKYKEKKNRNVPGQNTAGMESVSHMGVSNCQLQWLAIRLPGNRFMAVSISPKWFNLAHSGPVSYALGHYLQFGNFRLRSVLIGLESRRFHVRDLQLLISDIFNYLTHLKESRDSELYINVGVPYIVIVYTVSWHIYV